MKTKSLLAALLAGCLFFAPVLLHAQINNDNSFNSGGTPANENSFNSSNSSTSISTNTSTNLSTGNSFNSGNSKYNPNQYFKCNYGHYHPCSLDDGHHDCPYHNSVPFDGALGISLLLVAAIFLSVKRKLNTIATA